MIRVALLLSAALIFSAGMSAGIAYGEALEADRLLRSVCFPLCLRTYGASGAAWSPDSSGCLCLVIESADMQ